MMWSLIAVNVVVFLLETGLTPPQLQGVFYLFGLVPARYSAPEWAAQAGFPAAGIWPWLTHLFLHGGWLHLIGNLWMLWIFADNVEDRMGPIRFLLFFLLCGLVAAGAHWASNPLSTLPTVGASGAIAGVLGAYLMMYPLARVIVMVPVLIFPFFFELPAALFLIIWFVINITSGLSALSVPVPTGGVAWWAHAGGFIAGVMFYRVFLRRGGRVVYDDELGIDSGWQR